MRKTFKYRLFPSKAQIRKLNQTLGVCRWLYNRFLEDRKFAWLALGMQGLAPA